MAKKTAEPKAVPVSDFGKDHWSLMAYIETLCVDSINKGIGTIDKRRVRANEKTHPLHAVNSGHGIGWESSYGTRLSCYCNEQGNTCPSRQLPDHDDWDCLNDLEAAGLIDVISEANGFVKLTDKGREVAGRLRAHKSKGGMFATFSAGSV